MHTKRNTARRTPSPPGRPPRHPLWRQANRRPWRPGDSAPHRPRPAGHRRLHRPGQLGIQHGGRLAVWLRPALGGHPLHHHAHRPAAQRRAPGHCHRLVSSLLSFQWTRFRKASTLLAMTALGIKLIQLVEDAMMAASSKRVSFDEAFCAFKRGAQGRLLCRRLVLPCHGIRPHRTSVVPPVTQNPLNVLRT